jgi:phytoene dehydrogenase-like protein
MPDAVVIGAGPNGLVAANLLADAGWSVVVLEEQDEPGGAVKSGELTGRPGFTHDLFSAFYPLAAASPTLRRLGLERYGLRWRRGSLALAHPAPDGTCASLSMDLEETASSLDAFAPGDGDAWRELYGLWRHTGRHILAAMGTPMPPLRPGLRLARELGPSGLVRFARTMVLPVRRLGEERFRGAGGRRLLAGNALHTDLSPETAFGGFYGWLLTALGQEVGFPFPEGGAGRLTHALVRRLEERGGRVETGTRVTEVLVRRGRAVAARTPAGDVDARRAILADVDAPQLYIQLLAREHVPARMLDDLRRFHWDYGTVKVDWALEGPVPWSAPEARRAPVVHVSDGLDELTTTMSELARGVVPTKPFLILGQYAAADPTRCPPGKEVAWAYAHVPQGAGLDEAAFVDRMEGRIEELAPGFRELVLARHVFSPTGLERANRNLVGGSLNGGTAQLHQQFVFRPTARLGRPETVIRGLYLASASAYPGGGVHGAPGANAARAALTAARLKRI